MENLKWLKQSKQAETTRKLIPFPVKPKFLANKT